MSQPPPRRVLVDLDNIEFYRPQPSKSLRLGPPRSILPTLPPLSHLPVTADCDPSQGDGFPFPDHPYSENSACGAAPLNSFDVELAKFAAAEPQLMDSRTQNNLAQEGDGNTTLGTAEFSSASIGVAPLRDEKRLPSIAVVVPLPPRRKPSVVAQRQASKRQNQQCDVDDGSQHYSQSSELEPREPPRRSKRQRIMTRSMRKSSENALSQQSPGSPIHPIPPSPVLSQLSPAGYCSTRDIVGKAILTIESQGPQQEYFFSFTPILPSQLDKLSLQSSFPREPALSVDLARAPAARNPRKSVKNKPYSPAEEALLVKLKAAGTMDWQEIAQHFQNRSAGALQVHYSTKLKRKAASYRRRRSRSCRKNVL
ncbi:uncharacterized protein BDV17DRAFT_299020 [Aspergillus undulatus]|uniref:uncharacterized protein n=1 Tax=Aspergillus undulatus TaxID=1810928 RepID=UPI003CCCE2AD